MSDLTEWINYTLYPALFEAIPQAFPEHHFERWSGGWRSKTKLDGSPHTRADKTVITSQRPGRILEQGGHSLSLIDYVMQRDKLGDPQDKEGMLEAVKRLARVVGLSLPQSANFDSQAYRRSQERASLLEDAQEFFVSSLLSEEPSPEAEAVRLYLSRERGYSPELVIDMGLGFIPSQAGLRAYLVKTKKHSPEQADEFIKSLIHAIGTTHRLSIPHRSGGTLKGFKFRAIASDVKPKYLNSTGLKVGESFFNLQALQGYKDLVIVEGELDCLHATASGFENVVAPGGDFITPAQIEDAKRRGAKSFTLCFDNPPSDKFSKALELLGASGLKLYVAELPALGDKTDPDKLLREQGAEALRRAIAKAIPHYEHRLQALIDKYGEIQTERGLEAKDIDRLQEDVTALALSLGDPTERDRLVKLFVSLPAIKELGVTEESLSSTVDKLQYRKDREAQAQGLKRLLAEAGDLQAEGKAQEALDALASKSRELKLKDKATEFSRLLVRTDEGGLAQRMSSRPPSLSSGFYIGGAKPENELLLPAGAISIIAAPTSHGKTSMLINMSLTIARAGKRVYYFTYEEASDFILMYALNTFINKKLSANNRKSIESYYSKRTDEYILAEM